MRFLVSLYCGIGNGILSTPFLRVLAAGKQRNDVILLGNNRTGVFDCLYGLPFIRSIRVTGDPLSLRERYDLIAWIRKMRFDAIFLPFASTPIWLQTASLMMKAKTVVRHVSINPFRKIDAIIVATKLLSGVRTKLVPIIQGRHEIDLYLDMAEVFFGRPFERDYKTCVNYEKDVSVRKRFGLPDKYICIQPGAANGLETNKKWPTENFRQLIDTVVAENQETGIVIVGGKQEFQTAIKPLLDNNPKVVNTAGMTTLNDVVNIIRFARLVVCHDSGIMHIADSLGTPLVALYGPTDFTRTAPKGRHSVVLRDSLPCSPCMYALAKGDGPSSCTNVSCMKSLHAKRVTEEIGRLLQITP